MLNEPVTLITDAHRYCALAVSRAEIHAMKQMTQLHQAFVTCWYSHHRNVGLTSFGVRVYAHLTTTMRLSQGGWCGLKSAQHQDMLDGSLLIICGG